MVTFYAVGLFFIAMFLLSVGLASLLGKFLKSRQPLPFPPRPAPVRDDGAYVDPGVQPAAHVSRVLPMWTKESGLVYPSCRDSGLSLPAKARLERARAAYATRQGQTRVGSSNGPVGPGAA